MAFHNNITNWLVTKAAAAAVRQQHCQSCSHTKQPSARLPRFLLFWDRGRRPFSSKKHDRYGDFLFFICSSSASLLSKTFLQRSRILFGPWRPPTTFLTPCPPAVQLAKVDAPADWPTRTLRQAGVSPVLHSSCPITHNSVGSFITQRPKGF